MSDTHTHSDFSLEGSIDILQRTPSVLEALLKDAPDFWSRNNEGPDTWSPFDIIGHLVHGEKTDWIPRARLILSEGDGSRDSKTFEPFDRFAQFRESEGKTINKLLEEFAALRKQNIVALKEMDLSEDDFARTGYHPDFGEVTLRQLLATWTAHDLGHIRQAARVMAKQYKDEVGPWEEYLPVMGE